jgi:diguanylate cyclase (GGDEF)-like protein
MRSRAVTFARLGFYRHNKDYPGLDDNNLDEVSPMDPIILASYLCVLVGIFFVIRASLLAVKVRSELPPGALRIGWGMLIGLLVTFAACAAVLAFTLQVNDQGRLFGAGAFALGAGLAFQTSQIALETARQEKRLALQAEEKIHDSLTGLKTRSLFEERLEEEISRALRYSLPLSLLLIRLGSQAKPVGEPTLRMAGRILREKTRSPDIAARYDHETLAILLPNTPEDGAFMVAERLRQAIEAGQVGTQARAGVSILAALEHDGKELEHRAELALEKAGENGQNLTMAFQPGLDWDTGK